MRAERNEFTPKAPLKLIADGHDLLCLEDATGRAVATFEAWVSPAAATAMLEACNALLSCRQ
jgi:hypothetical protein